MYDNYDFPYYCDYYHFGKSKGIFSSNNSVVIGNAAESEKRKSDKNNGDKLRKN